MKKYLVIFLCMVCLSVSAQDISHPTTYGFTFATNVSGATYVWTNDNDYAFRLLNMSFNTDNANTAVVSVIRRHSINLLLHYYEHNHILCNKCFTLNY